MVIKKASDRSYKIKDNYNGYFRRNRRFVARTDNVDVNTSDLFLEENIGSSFDKYIPEDHRVPPASTNDIGKEGSIGLDSPSNDDRTPV